MTAQIIPFPERRVETLDLDEMAAAYRQHMRETYGRDLEYAMVKRVLRGVYQRTCPHVKLIESGDA